MAGCWCKIPDYGCSQSVQTSQKAWWQREALRVAVIWLTVVQTHHELSRDRTLGDESLLWLQGTLWSSFQAQGQELWEIKVWTMLSCTLFPLLHSTGRSYCTIKYLSSILSWLHIFILWLSCNKFTLSLCFFFIPVLFQGTKLQCPIS